MSFSFTPFFEVVFHTGLKLSHATSLASQQAPGILRLHLPGTGIDCTQTLPHPACHVGAVDQILIFTLLEQELLTTEPSSQLLFTKVDKYPGYPIVCDIILATEDTIKISITISPAPTLWLFFFLPLLSREEKEFR